MSKYLLIVESPSKARTIKKFLGKDFQVVASVGHVRDLPQKELGVDIEKNFTPKYVTIQGKTKIIQQLKAAAKEASKIYLAPDPDREGEAIAWHIANLLKADEKSIERVLFNEITRSGIQYGIAHPRKIDTSLVNAQQARRILDRLVGYQVSPILWRTVFRGLSAGRVQSVAVRIICEREEEIEIFKPVEFWDIFADLKTGGDEEFTAKCLKIRNRKASIPDREAMQGHLAALQNADYRVDALQVKEVRKSPAPPFTTSTLQQESTRRFKFTATRTMRIAQQLYEGIDIEGDPAGLITYMRTDSVRISNEAVNGIRDYIAGAFGQDYLPAKARHFQTKKKNVQDAHEGIRPTRIDLPPDKIAAYLSKEQLKLYSLIWNRFTACQMEPAVYSQKTIDVSAGEYLFRTVGTTLIFDGFLRTWKGDQETSDNSDKLPRKLEAGDPLELLRLRPEQKFTEPPVRFTEGTLIKELDSLGIGRPSTYATIVSTIIDRKYIEKKINQLSPTELGKTTNKILVNGMPDIFNIKFTSQMEDDLDSIEANRKDWLTVLNDFYPPFKKSLDQMDARRKEIKDSIQEKTDEICEQCGSPMVIKWSKNGRFMACSGFPECRNTRTLDGDDEPAREDKSCPNCGSPMVVKQGRFGKFWACSGYPKCKTTEPFTMNISCPEPDCGGKIVEKHTKRGKIFYGCSNYPNCKFASWNEPVDKKCESCGHPILERKTNKSKNIVNICPQCKTEFPDGV